MGKGNKNTNRNRTKALRVDLEDWLIIDEVAGEDRPMREGFHEIVEGYKELENMEEADLSGILED